MDDEEAWQDTAAAQLVQQGGDLPLPKPKPRDLMGAGAMPAVPRQMFKPNDPAYNYNMLQQELAKRQQFNDLSEMEAWLDWQGYGENQAMPNSNLYHINPRTYDDSMAALQLQPPISDDAIERSFRMYRDYGKRI